jgi:2'-5' RNA ligase
MSRLFVGIDLPEWIDDVLEGLCAGVPGARWEGRDKFHVTLRFLGDVQGRKVGTIEDRIAALRHPAFRVALRGIGFFPPRGQPRALWVGLEPEEPVRHLKQAVDRALAGLDLPIDGRRFSAHVTLARLRGTPAERVVRYMAERALFRSDGFDVTSFQLFSSVLSPGGSKYGIEASFPLGRDG